MKKTTIMISTAALMAGTACGVYAESGDHIATSFDRKGGHIDMHRHAHAQPHETALPAYEAEKRG